MKHKRLSVALASAALLALALAGCSNGGASGGSSGVLTISGKSGGDYKGLVAVGKVFTEETGTKVNITQDGSSNYGTTLRTQLGAGTAPDLFFIFPGNGQPAAEVPLAKAGLLADLGSLGFKDKIPPAYVSGATYEGKVYAVPQTQGMIGAIYNQDTMTSTGLTAPKTFSDVLKFCGDAQAKGKVAYALGLTDGFVAQMISYALSATLVYSPTPDFSQQQLAGKVTFEDSAWKQVFDEYVQMNDAHCFTNNFQGASFNSMADAVAKGDALGLVGVNAFLPQIVDAAPSGTKFQIEPLPATDDAAATHIPAAFAAGYSVNAKAKNKDAAMKFAKLLASPKGQELYAQAAAALPVFITDSFKPDAALTPMLPFLSANKFSTYPNQDWPNSKVSDVHASVVSEMLSGDLSVDGALQQMDAAWKDQ